MHMQRTSEVSRCKRWTGETWLDYKQEHAWRFICMKVPVQWKDSAGARWYHWCAWRGWGFLHVWARGTCGARSSGRGAAAAGAARRAAAVEGARASAGRRPRRHPWRLACLRRSCSRSAGGWKTAAGRARDRYVAPQPRVPRALFDRRPPSAFCRSPAHAPTRFVLNF